MSRPPIERRLAELEATVEQHGERISSLDTAGTVSRRSLLQGLGIVGLGGYAAGPASADPQGQLGTATDPVRVAHLQQLAGGVTDGTPIASLLGPGLYVEEDVLRAAILGAANLGGGEGLFAGVADGTLQFRSLVAGRNVDVDRRENEIVLEADDSDTNNGGRNLGGGAEMYAGRSGRTLEFRTLTARGALTATRNADTVSVGGPWADADDDGLLEPRSGTGYDGIDLSGAASPQVVTPWVGTTSATAFEAFVDGGRVGHFGTEGTDRDDNAAAGNVLLGQYASVTDGAVGAAVGGGGSPADDHENVVADDYGVVGGGENNRAGSTDGDPMTGSHATVGGGWSNTASGENATVGGGSSNTASAYRSTVGGGFRNEVTADYATIAGGGPSDEAAPSTTNNLVSARYGTVAGGGNNDVFDSYGTVGGGGENRAGSDDGTDNRPYATVGGGYGNTAGGRDSTVAGGSTNAADATRSTVGGGALNDATSHGSSVGGGEENVAQGGDHPTVGGGYRNVADGTRATVAGGNANAASDNEATVSGGLENSALAPWSTIGGGRENAVYDDYATIAGGHRNQAGSDDGDTTTSWGATVPGGLDNAAIGAYSFAAGRRAKANDFGAFVWADGTDADFASDQAGTGSSPTGSDTFHVRSTGGLRLVTGLDAADDPNAGVYLASGGSSWQTVSARSAKHDVSPVDPATVLDGVRDLNVSTWAYDSNPGVTHMGPMAGDFHEAFDLGDDPETIGHVDADGVALAAIQGLADHADELERALERKDDRIEDIVAECEAKDEAIDALESEVREQEERIADLERRLSTLESALDGTDR